MNRPMVGVLRFASILSGEGAHSGLCVWEVKMARLVITKEKEDSPVPLGLLFEKRGKAVVSDMADVAKEGPDIRLTFST
jgi:hypothetical protein